MNSAGALRMSAGSSVNAPVPLPIITIAVRIPNCRRGSRLANSSAMKPMVTASTLMMMASPVVWMVFADGLRRRRGPAVVRGEPDAEVDGVVDPDPEGNCAHQDGGDVDGDAGEPHEAEHQHDGKHDRGKPQSPPAMT